MRRSPRCYSPRGPRMPPSSRCARPVRCTSHRLAGQRQPGEDLRTLRRGRVPEHRSPGRCSHPRRGSGFLRVGGVSLHPRVDARRAEQRNSYPLNNLGRHPHQAFGQLWKQWQADEVAAAATCDQGHSAYQQLSPCVSELPPLRCPGAVTPRAVPLAARSQPRPAPSPVAADPSPAIGLDCDASVRRPLAARLPAARDGAVLAGPST